MAIFGNHLYLSAKQKMLSGQTNWTSDNIVCVLVNTMPYTYSPFHASLADVPVAARIATSGTLTNRTATNGVANASAVTFTSPSAGTLASALILCTSGTSDLASPLLAYMDQASGLPLTTDGNPVTINWSAGTNSVFSL